MRRIPFALLLAGVFGLVMPTAGWAGMLTLHPSGFGPHSYAAWAAGAGNPSDSDGATSNQALYFQKMVPTATNAAGVAVVRGVAGMAATDLTDLSWQHRTDGHCGAGAPRWDVFVQGVSGTNYTLFLGCTAAAHSPDTAANWCNDSYGGSDTILGTGAANAGLTGQLSDIKAGTITGLSIVFDEGNDSAGNPVPECGQVTGAAGFVFLDNVTVNGNVWTDASGNGNG